MLSDYVHWCFWGSLAMKEKGQECDKGQPCLSETPVKLQSEYSATNIVPFNWKFLWQLKAWELRMSKLKTLNSL